MSYECELGNSMDDTNITSRFLRIDNDSNRVEVQGQWEHFYFKEVITLIPNPSEDDGVVQPKIGPKFIQLRTQSYLKSGMKIIFLSSPHELPYYSVAPTTKPRHRILFDSFTFQQFGVFEPSLPASSSVGARRDESKLLLSSQKSSTFGSSILRKAYLSWLCAEQMGTRVLMQCDLYDRSSNPFLKQKCARVWISERTMTRKLAQELEQLQGAATKQYTGVRWRPERKHPWIAEIKLPNKRKKMWIGNFDTPEEAARAYDAAAVVHGKETTVNFPRPSSRQQHVPEPPISSPKYTQHYDEEQDITTDSSMDIVFDDTDALVGEGTVQSISLPTLSNSHNWRANRQQTNVGDSSSDSADSEVVVVGGLLDLSETPQHVSTYVCNKLGYARKPDTDMKGYHMFATDLPSWRKWMDNLRR